MQFLDKAPDFTNENTRIALLNHKSFDYSAHGDQAEQLELIDLGPVQLSNGAIYTGQWGPSAKRHGKGK